MNQLERMRVDPRNPLSAQFALSALQKRSADESELGEMHNHFTKLQKQAVDEEPMYTNYIAAGFGNLMNHNADIHKNLSKIYNETRDINGQDLLDLKDLFEHPRTLGNHKSFLIDVADIQNLKVHGNTTDILPSQTNIKHADISTPVIDRTRLQFGTDLSDNFPPIESFFDNPMNSRRMRTPKTPIHIPNNRRGSFTEGSIGSNLNTDFQRAQEDDGKHNI